MAKNCSADVQAVVAHVDSVYASGNKTAMNALQAQFGLSELEHFDDFADARTHISPSWSGFDMV